MSFSSQSEKSAASKLCKTHLIILVPLIYLLFIFLPNLYNLNFIASAFFSPFYKTSVPEPKSRTTNLGHIGFGLLGSERAWHHRKSYIESWWRPNETRGFLYLDKTPTGDLIPWSNASPPYRISHDLTKFLQETQADPVVNRLLHGILEAFRELDNENLRWIVMGDDDSVFFVDNIVDVLAQYDHTKYYYLGGHSEFIVSNYLCSFNQGFGGAGFMLSYPLAKALANDMENCMRRYVHLNFSDLITMACIADIGVNLSPLKGIHQTEFRGDISGFLSSHPKFPLMSLHHFDSVEPIFPDMIRSESTRHLMKAAAADQSRMLQQTICYHKLKNWSFSISWGYSAHIYEKLMPRSYLQKPIETFKHWLKTKRLEPHYMFNTRFPSNKSCESPHVFFFQRVEKTSTRILTTYSRASPRGLPPRSLTGDQAADYVSEIRVFSPATKQKEMDRCECCDIVRVGGAKVELKFRECKINEIIA